MDRDAREFKIPDYAELKDPPPRGSIVQTGVSTEGVKSGSVSRAKFDLVKDKLKNLQVDTDKPHPLLKPHPPTGGV